MSVEEKRLEDGAVESFNSSKISVNPDVEDGAISQSQDVEKGNHYDTAMLASDGDLVSYFAAFDEYRILTFVSR